MTPSSTRATHLFLALFALLPLPALAGGGGGGVRGGGTGILCAGETSPLTLEESELRRDGAPAALPSDRREALAWVIARLASDEKLVQRVRETWEALGPVDAWPKWSEENARDFSALDPESRSISLAQEIVTVLQRAKIPLAFDPQKNPVIVNDDFGKVPADCTKIQLSVLYENRAHLAYPGALNEQTKRFLELHETLYLVGMRNYHQVLPLPARKLVRAMNAAESLKKRRDRKSLEKAVEKFTGHDLPAEHAFYGLNQVLFLSATSSRISRDESGNEIETKPACPLGMSLLYDGEKQRGVFFEIHDGRVRPVERVLDVSSPNTTGSGFVDVLGGIVFGGRGPIARHLTVVEDPTTPFMPLWSTVLMGSGSGEYVLRLYGHAAAEYWYGDRLPLRPGQITGNASGGGCFYGTWTPSTKIDPKNLAKLWNQIILDHPPKTSSTPNEFK